MSVADQLLTPEAEAWIGFSVMLPPEPIIEREVLRYLVATGVPLPAERGASLRVPPLFYRTLGRRISSVDEIGEDGLWPGLRPNIGVGQVLAGGIDVEFARPLVIGDVIGGERKLTSLTPKSGRKLDFVLARWTTLLTDELGAEVLREDVTEIMY